LLLFLFVLFISGTNFILAAEKGSLQVLSSPEGSDVFIDGVLAGNTPFLRTDFNPGEYKIEVRKSGKTLEKTITVKEGFLETINFRLSDEIRVGWLIDDPYLDERASSGSYSVIAFDLSSPSPNMVFIPVIADDFKAMKLEGIRKKYSLDYFISLKYQQEYGSSKEARLVLNAYLYDYTKNRNLFERKYINDRALSGRPRPSEVDPFRKRAYKDFSNEITPVINSLSSGLESGSSRIEVESTELNQQGADWKINEWITPDYSGTPFRYLIGQKAPSFQLRDRTGVLFNSGSFFGRKVVLLYFFDASFAFCKKDMDEISLLYQDHPDQFIPIGISVTGKGSRRLTAENFLRTRVYEYPVVFDTSGISDKYYVNNAVPLWVLIDRKGIVRYIKRGTWNMLPLYRRIDYLQRED
jgi:peroxiredoxin